MLTLTAHFDFGSDRAALATLSVPSPHSDRIIRYAGEIDFLPDRPAELDASVFRVWARRVADQAGAKLTLTEVGEFDWWAGRDRRP